MDHNDMMAVLADAAVFDQPRLFAVHGLYTRAEGGHILGWGMEFADDLGAVYADPVSGTTRTAPPAPRACCGRCGGSVTWS